VRALREAAKLRGSAQLSAIDVAFRLTPRLNAPGRLGDPTLTLRLLLEPDLQRARVLAAEVERINSERRALEQRVTEEATQQVQGLASVPAGLVAASRDFHRGVVGITAARLVDRFHRPALVVAIEGGVAHGSGRAPDGFPLHAALLRARALLEKFGGHDAAVGFSLQAENIPLLRDVFGTACAELAETASERPLREIDLHLGGEGYALPRASELHKLEPFGEANPDPLCLIEAEVVRASIVGEGHLKLALRIGEREFSAFGYQLGKFATVLGRHVRLVGNLRPDAYRGGEHVELKLHEILGVPPTDSRADAAQTQGGAA